MNARSGKQRARFLIALTKKPDRALLTLGGKIAVCGHDFAGHLVASRSGNRHSDGATWSCSSCAGQRCSYTVFLPRHPGRPHSQITHSPFCPDTIGDCVIVVFPLPPLLPGRESCLFLHLPREKRRTIGVTFNVAHPKFARPHPSFFAGKGMQRPRN